jgi:GH15 family glucan-1,4-alpha-glucosidase
MPAKIEDYALIGDTETAALVCVDGSIDWLCLPRFDSGACFAALLGTPEHGRWQIAPATEVRDVTRSYQGDTLVLETMFETEKGRVALIDFMPPRSGVADLIRIVEGRGGTVPMQMELRMRFDYGSAVPWVRHIERGIRATAGPDTLYCRSDVELRGEDLTTVAEFEIREGERIAFDLTWAPTYASAPGEKDEEEALRSTLEWWNDWSSRCTWEGEWRDAVVRSLITLKALTYAPTGGLVAAATTSLPELIGGVRNWDYRYCWLRDAAFTLQALMSGGYTEEAREWREWLVNSVAGSPGQLQIMYGLAGERRLPELEIPWLPGYEDSAPVRIGNAAHEQFQLDVYGAVMDALHVARQAGLEPSENAWRVQGELMKFLEEGWSRPDEGIWEVRGSRRPFTHSRLMAWVAADRAVRGVEDFGFEGPVEKWRSLRETIRNAILEEGYDRELGAFVQFTGSKELDASLLMIPLVGFLPADDPRVVGTVEAIGRDLAKDGFIRRYRTEADIDGLPPGEGAFLLCSFWMADNLALQGRRDEARERFEALLALRNDVGLLSEQWDTERNRMVGNFPQAFSHIGLINTARLLSERKVHSS